MYDCHVYQKMHTELHSGLHYEISMDSKFCLCCNLYYNNIVDHCINTCAYLEKERANLWLGILEIGVQAYIFLCNTDGSRVTDVLLGMEIAEFARILGDTSDQFKICCIVNLHKMWCK